MADDSIACMELAYSTMPLFFYWIWRISLFSISRSSIKETCDVQVLFQQSGQCSWASLPSSRMETMCSEQTCCQAFPTQPKPSSGSVVLGRHTQRESCRLLNDSCSSEMEVRIKEKYRESMDSSIMLSTICQGLQSCRMLTCC